MTKTNPGSRAAPAPFSLAGKAIVVTGAADPYGRAAAQRFADAGAQVLLSDKRSVGDLARRPLRKSARGREESSRPTGAVTGLPYHPADPWDEEQVHDLMRHAVGLFGRLDGLFCNAGSEAAVNEWPLTDVVERMIDDELTQNYKSTLWAIKSAAPHMTDGSSIVTMTADTAFTGAATMGAWAAAKAAAAAVARSAALELAARRIRVNCVSVGPLETAYLDSTEFESGIAARLTPMGRLGRPDELAALVQFLLADESAYVTGAIIPFDGGASAGVVAPNILDALAEAIGVIR